MNVGLEHVREPILTFKGKTLTDIRHSPCGRHFSVADSASSVYLGSFSDWYRDPSIPEYSLSIPESVRDGDPSRSSTHRWLGNHRLLLLYPHTSRMYEYDIKAGKMSLWGPKHRRKQPSKYLSVSTGGSTTYAAVSGANGLVELWDARSKRSPVITFKNYNLGTLRAVDIDVNSLYIVTGSENGTVGVHDIRAGLKVAKALHFPHSVGTVSADPDTPGVFGFQLWNYSAGIFDALRSSGPPALSRQGDDDAKAPKHLRGINSDKITEQEIERQRHSRKAAQYSRGSKIRFLGSTSVFPRGSVVYLYKESRRDPERLQIESWKSPQSSVCHLSHRVPGAVGFEYSKSTGFITTIHIDGTITVSQPRLEESPET